MARQGLRVRPPPPPRGLHVGSAALGGENAPRPRLSIARAGRPGCTLRVELLTRKDRPDGKAAEGKPKERAGPDPRADRRARLPAFRRPRSRTGAGRG